MDELAREYFENHDPEIPEEIYRLERQLEELDHDGIGKRRQSFVLGLLPDRFTLAHYLIYSVDAPFVLVVFAP